MVRKYYTLEDLINHYSNEDQGWDTKLDCGEVIDGYLTNLAQAVFAVILSSSSPVKQTRANELFCRYIAPSFKKHFIGYLELDDNGAIHDSDVYQEWMRKFIVILNATYDRYSVLLAGYESIRARLLDPVKTIVESKYNDTPQNVQGVYEWSTDDHLTNVSKTETANDVNSPISRLDEVNRLIDDYYLNWRDQFNDIFLFNDIFW